jgi:hypothetical protein
MFLKAVGGDIATPGQLAASVIIAAGIGCELSSGTDDMSVRLALAAPHMPAGWIVGTVKLNRDFDIGAPTTLSWVKKGVRYGVRMFHVVEPVFSTHTSPPHRFIGWNFQALPQHPRVFTSIDKVRWDNCPRNRDRSLAIPVHTGVEVSVMGDTHSVGNLTLAHATEPSEVCVCVCSISYVVCRLLMLCSLENQRCIRTCGRCCGAL